ncbi:MAG TPA: hypothetical protein VHH36_04230, partial [Candidatus Thermoplasmatota archaeon]|nr:hypothetical protein [Candidatus Thermoplasmatota archaeon]
MEDHRPRCLALVAFVALAALTAAPASAQGNRPVTIAPASAEANVTEGSPALFDLHLSSADALLPHAARLVLDGPPAGWTYRFTPAVVNLSAGGEANATLVLYPPASAVAGDVVNFTFHAVEDGPTSIPLSGDVAVSVSILPP